MISIKAVKRQHMYYAYINRLRVYWPTIAHENNNEQKQYQWSLDRASATQTLDLGLFLVGSNHRL